MQANAGDDDELVGTAEWKAADKSKGADKSGPKRLLTRDGDRGKSSLGRQKGAMIGGVPGMGVDNTWMAGLGAGLGAGDLQALAAASSWPLSHSAFLGAALADADLGGLGLKMEDSGGMMRMEDTNDVATGAADFILDEDEEGDDDQAGDLQGLADGGDDSLHEHASFDAPAGWASAASREGWGQETSSSWDSRALSQGPSVNIEKAFGAFNGVGDNTVLGGLAYSIPTSQSNMVWGGSGSMMPMAFDVTSDWHMSRDGDGENAHGVGLAMPQGWAEPPPDSFQQLHAGDEAGDAQGRLGGKHLDSRGRQKKSWKERKKEKQPPAAGAGTKKDKSRAPAAAAGDALAAPSAAADAPLPNAAEAASRGSGGGRGSGAQSGGGASRGRRGGEKAAKAPSAAEGAAGSQGAAPKEKPEGGEAGGGKPGRKDDGRNRGRERAAKMVAVPATIRLAAEDRVRARGGGGGGGGDVP